MPSEEKEFRITGGLVTSDSLPKGLRLLKTVKAADSGVYIVPMPGLLPPGLHISLHPSGEVHLKGRDFSVTARVDIGQILKSLQNGELDDVFDTFLREPENGHSAEGIVVPENLVKFLRETTGTVEIPAEQLAASINRIEIEDTEGLAGDLDWLRSKGILAKGTMLMLSVAGSDRITVFINVLQNRLLATLPAGIPMGALMKRTIESGLAQLRKYGGIFVTFPDEGELERLADRIGLGELFGAIAHLEDVPGMADVESAWKKVIPDLEAMFGKSVAGFLERPSIKPDSSAETPKKDTPPRPDE
jgi:hypothetical protein